MVGQAKQARFTTTTLGKPSPEGSETEEAPQIVKCPLPAQHQTGYSSRLDEQETLHIPLNIFQSLLARSRVKSLM